jgi:uncharacterized SAM-binding protein YcdF (DUF218 family)
MSVLVSYVFSGSGLTITLIVAAAAIWLRLAPGPTRRIFVALAALYALATIYVVPYGVGRVLTLGYHPFELTDIPPGTSAIVLLGGGDTITTPVEAARILEARRVFRLMQTSWIISSGGPPNAPDRSAPSGDVMRGELIRLGVPAERILLESTSRNTYDEAMLIAPMLKTLGVQNIVLVTSDVHMRRSLLAFQAVGWRAVPAIAPDYRRPIHLVDWLLPTARGLDLSSEIAHELFGIPYYWMRSRRRS